MLKPRKNKKQMPKKRLKRRRRKKMSRRKRKRPQSRKLASKSWLRRKLRMPRPVTLVRCLTSSSHRRLDLRKKS